MQPSIIIPHINSILPQLILFDPVNLKITKGFAVPAADHGEGVFRAEGVLEEGFLAFDVAGGGPEVVDAGFVHPFVEEVGVAGVEVQALHGGDDAVAVAFVEVRAQGWTGHGARMYVWCGTGVGGAEGEVLAYGGYVACVECFAWTRGFRT